MIYQLVIISVFLTSWSSLKSPEENLFFDIVHNNKIIGSLNTTKTIKDNKTYYHSSTTIETRIIEDIRVNYKYDVIFVSTILEKSDVNITVNEKPYAETYTQLTDTNYEIVKNDKTEKKLNDSISYATIQLYFKEPINISRSYSEQDGSFNTIISLGNHAYKKVNSKGRKNIYHYKNGLLKKATIDGGLFKFKMIAKE